MRIEQIEIRNYHKSTLFDVFSFLKDALTQIAAKERYSRTVYHSSSGTVSSLISGT